jgi:hypothetical protein
MVSEIARLEGEIAKISAPRSEPVSGKVDYERPKTGLERPSVKEKSS